MSGTKDNLPSVVPPPAAPSEQDIEALRRQIAQAREQVQQTARAMDQGQIQEMNDRSMITRVVILVFGGSIGAVLLAIVIAGIASGKAEAIATQAVDLLKSVVLPIVTLVLGYYFGRAGKAG
ncbi:hypothetical protein [Falsiroseomonas sp. HW251]|uniref:hypothetical protein n=1 Tax=Falsiroseomonas sp. HW251 TaxID=3390998 RepID=UPI003D317365